MARRATLRASDADRDNVAERLRQAAEEGRLATEELEQRLEVALAARTYSELDMVVADLPGPSGPRRATGRQSRGLALVRPALALAIAIPVSLALIAAVLLAVTGVLAAWWLWLAAGWWFFGHNRRRMRAMRGAHAWHHGAHAWHTCGGWHRSRAHTTRSLL